MADYAEFPAFSRDAFSLLLRSQFTSLSERVSAALPDVAVPLFDRTPDVADAWTYGLYATILGRLPDAEGFMLHAAALRDGDDVRTHARSLVHSEEGQASGTLGTPNVHEAFVIGAYLTVLGRVPGNLELTAWAAQLDDGRATPADTVSTLVGSEEARRSARFPPEPIPRNRLLAEAAQVLLLGTTPDAALTKALCEAHAAGGTRHMARVLLRRDRRWRGVLRSFVVSRGIAREIEIGASARGAHLETLATRRWQWYLATGSAHLAGRSRQEIVISRQTGESA